MSTRPAPSAADMLNTWTSRAWRTESEAWIVARLADIGIAPNGPIEQARVRPWSTHLTVPTSKARYWFKENSSALVFEAGLVDQIARISPQRVITPVAVSTDRGWLLSPDGGPTAAETGADAATFTAIMGEYAELQRSLVDHAGALLATGLEVIDVADTADHVDRQVAALAALPTDHPLHADAELRAQVARHRPTITSAQDRLGEIAVAATVQHNDLQHDNTFAPSSGPLRFFDFGDALWSHPFCSLHVTITKLQQRWTCGSDDPRIRRLIDAYLEHWTDLAPIPALRRLVAPARVIGRWHRYNSWYRLLPHFPAHQLRSRVGYLDSLLRTDP